MQNWYFLLEQKTPSWLKNLIPESWRIKLGYQIKVKRNRGLSKLTYLQHELLLPVGETETSIFDYLAEYYIEGEGPSEEFKMYLKEAFRRFLYTLQIIPEGEGELLEIGASPYFISLLLKRFTNYSLSHTNYFGSQFPDKSSQTMVNRHNDRVKFEYDNVNIEAQPMPFAENTFDVVLLCEVLEHFTNDPLRVLLEIKRVLKPDGYLILTTPNVSRLENVARMISGLNIYDPYSGYGPYGRHNREYTTQELTTLLSYVGFEIETLFTSDVYNNRAHFYCSPNRFIHLTKGREEDLGQYIFVKAQNCGEATLKKPRWLYRSYPPEQLGE